MGNSKKFQKLIQVYFKFLNIIGKIKKVPTP
jgi:hypothetical protein